MNPHSKLSLDWCKIGIASLGLAGVYSIILVVLRTPFLSSIFTDKDIFKTALVVHVDLSVLVWLLACSVIIWINRIADPLIYSTLKTISHIAFLGILLIVISPWLVEENNPVLNNYIPMLDNFWFVLGLSVFSTSLFMISIISSFGHKSSDIQGTIGSIIFIISTMCLFLSYNKIQNEIPYPMDLYGFYEMLFWSTGHSLQFLYMHTMYSSAIIILGSKPRFVKFYYFTIWTNLFMALTILPVHFMENIDTSEFIGFCTDHMRYAGGISCFFIITSIISEVISLPKQTKCHVGILCSLILFISGGIIGIAITGTNVTVPAHYHGSTVGISIIGMSLVYYFLGIKDNSYPKIQIIIYTVGQLMHISGLAWSGGYGVLRKNPNIELALNAKISMGIMGLGGLIAIIGGLMFVIICARRIATIKNK